MQSLFSASIFCYFLFVTICNGRAKRIVPPNILPSVTNMKLFITSCVGSPPRRKAAMVKIPIFAIQCSKPAITKAVIIQNITTSFPLSVFILVPMNTARHTR